jgi:uroporphyrinogen decarboxylase
MLNKKLPVWFMRQAGRYLPEYRKISEKHSFFEMSETPEIAAEITLQPIKRFDLDAAIIFSDILTLPRAMGCEIDIKKVQGPVIKEINSINELSYESFDNNIQPTLDAIKLVREELDKGKKEKSLIGFAGGPWTVASYIIEGGWTKSFLRVRKFIHYRKDEFRNIINLITDATIKYLSKQIDNGADIVQIFDSFAGIPSFEEFNEFIIKPTRIIADAINKPVIGFPKGAGTSYVEYTKNTKVDVIGTDYALSVDWIKDNLQEIAIVQGNLDPYLLAFDKEAAVLQTRKIIEKLGNKNFIFNLGHGIFKETPIENVEAVIQEINNHR